MTASLTEDMVRDKARDVLGLEDCASAKAGVGQLTTFNQLGFPGVVDKPDGWCLPYRTSDVALVLETKASHVALGEKQVDELLKNMRIVESRFDNVVGVLYNGHEVRAFSHGEEIEVPSDLQRKEYYQALLVPVAIDKERIYELTARINNRLHFEFGIKNLYHRMIFTACALVAKRFDALMVEGMGWAEFHNAILNCLNQRLLNDRKLNHKLSILTETFADIRMNLNAESEDVEQQQHVKLLIAEFIGWVSEISDCLNSDAWRGEDVMGIFFNEFNRYKKKSDVGQVFTPEHITDFMYRILDVGKDDFVLDATCGSGGFLVKAMSNMIREAGGMKTSKAEKIMHGQLFGMEFDREIYALACANMLIHLDGKTNLEQMDARTGEASRWIKKQGITKVLMNPPFENKYGCMDIVENVLASVPVHTECGFILPDKKLEKTRSSQVGRLLAHNRIKKIVKLPEDLFVGTSITTSIFVFEVGVPQKDAEIFCCYMAQDGLKTVKNKGRHDVQGRWPEIADYWVDSIAKLRDDLYGTDQWIDPREHLSYQMPGIPFEIAGDDFRKTAMDYLMYRKGIDADVFGQGLLDKMLYRSSISARGEGVSVLMGGGADVERA